MRPFHRELLLLVVLLLATVKAVAASDFLPVEEAFKLQVEIEDGQVVALWDIAPGYYLYQQRLNIKPASPDYALSAPEFSKGGMLKNDPTFGEQIVYYDTAELRADVYGKKSGAFDLDVTFQGCADGGLCYPPQTQTVSVQLQDPPAGTVAASEPRAGGAKTETSASGLAGLMQTSSWTWILLTFFVLGVGLTFTPCVLPMIPILSGIIIGQQQKPTLSRAFLLSLSYVLGMAITYALTGLLAGYFGAQWNLQAWMQQPWVLILFGLVFVALALSMFGLYELQLPAALRNRLDEISRRQNGGQVPAVALMGVLSALVVSPCVSAPLAGALIYISATGDALMGGAALFSLAMGMGVPLLLIGTFGSHILPRAGHWMNRMKEAFGVMLLAVAVWLVQRLLPTSVALLLWAFLFVGVGLHLGALRRDTHGWLVTLQTVGMAALVWGLLLLVGAAQGQGSLIQPLSGFAGSAISTDSSPTEATTSFHRIETRTELESIVGAGQPVMLDFYADWCISCIVMEEEVFSTPQVQKLRDNIRFVQLDVTDFSAEHKQVLDELDLIGPPAVLFFTGNGEEIRSARLVGEVGLSGFLETIENQVLPQLLRRNRSE